MQRRQAEHPPEPLSETELRVLRYLPTKLLIPEIAAAVRVRPHDQDTHRRHLYNDLDVHTRAQAVERARELGLLAPPAQRLRIEPDLLSRRNEHPHGVDQRLAKRGERGPRLVPTGRRLIVGRAPGELRGTRTGGGLSAGETRFGRVAVVRRAP